MSIVNESYLEEEAETVLHFGAIGALRDAVASCVPPGASLRSLVRHEARRALALGHPPRTVERLLTLAGYRLGLRDAYIACVIGEGAGGVS